MKKEVSLRFFDLPLVHHLALWKEREEQAEVGKTGEEGECDEVQGEASATETPEKFGKLPFRNYCPLILLLIWRGRPGTMIRNYGGK